MSNAPRGAVPQRDGQTYAIIPKLKLGLLDAPTLRKLADVIDKYQIPVVKITAGMRLALVGMKAEDVEPIWEDLGMDPAPAVGPCVRNVQSCPGSALCKFGKQDSLALGLELDEKFSGRKLPSKFKIGISGCPISCAESYARDLGFIGTSKGWTVLVGGFGSGKTRVADVLAEGVDKDEAVKLADKVLNIYAEQAKPGERLGRTIERIGLEKFKNLVLA
ncbi:NAD(P)H-nitrite reductase large subunit [Desulfohalotomaculum tongense]|uniref:NAD(P)/FAD-dependent oxidoreductase n=1 Tax=Desulforadius tongensis TaxID=1216062 RepID=UPI00195DF64A|nr:NAD(P)/FAD-dependent oxidoreductase [Desulforadius tongensis]MBM7853944.1 NAD(P)H-nitrite reductase large subunit [Desulforadius tongensis]